MCCFRATIVGRHLIEGSMRPYVRCMRHGRGLEAMTYKAAFGRMQFQSCINQSAACAGHTEANKQVKVAEDHDSSSGTKDNRSPEQKVLQESTDEEGHTGHVSPAGLNHLLSTAEHTAPRCHVSSSYLSCIWHSKRCRMPGYRSLRRQMQGPSAPAPSARTYQSCLAYGAGA